MSGLWWGPSSGLQTAIFWLYPSVEEGRWESWCLFYEGTDLTVRALPSWSYHLPKPPLRSTITLGLRASTQEFWRHKHSVHDTFVLPPTMDWVSRWKFSQRPHVVCERDKHGAFVLWWPLRLLEDTQDSEEPSLKTEGIPRAWSPHWWHNWGISWGPPAASSRPSFFGLLAVSLQFLWVSEYLVFLGHFWLCILPFPNLGHTTNCFPVPSATSFCIVSIQRVTQWLSENPQRPLPWGFGADLIEEPEGEWSLQCSNPND